MKKFKPREIYTFTKQGTFGRFSTTKSFPIEYVTTSFLHTEFSDLAFARDIQLKKLDFETLMQRDIDEERVRLQIEPYIFDPKATEAELRSRAIFFPPLLAAITAVQNKQMVDLYPDEIILRDDADTITREWPGLFKITFFINSSRPSFTFNLSESEAIGVDIAPVNIEICPAKDNDYGASLVVIDGQHRLFALKQLLDRHPDLLASLIVPVCILFSPNSTAYQVEKYKTLKIPTVPEVFRHLFVDINTTMELVGGHFNILLSDESIGSLICRSFCEQILNELGLEGLAVIEWNIKTRKESTVITREYSISSIGIIELALEKSFGGKSRQSLFKYLLNLGEIESLLYPEDDEDGVEFPKPISWEKFSLTQKKIILTQIRKYVIPCLKMILFDTSEFAKSFEIFKDEIKNWLESTDSNVKVAKNQILEYIPIPPGKEHEAARSLYQNFERRIQDRKETEIASIIKFAVFQRAVFEAWASYLDLLRETNLAPLEITSSFIDLINLTLTDRGRIFSPERPYMQNSVFSGVKIKPTEETKKSLANLIIAHLGGDDVAKQISESLGISDESVIIKLKDAAQDAASKFLSAFHKQRRKTFKSNYTVDYEHLSEEERDRLMKSEEIQKQNLLEVREGKRSKHDVSKEFDELIWKYVSKDVELASAELKRALKFETDIVIVEADDETTSDKIE
jgi:hypothetical protein